MIPILYDKTYQSAIDNEVIGYLSDCISCEVTEELNGAFTAELVYPVGGQCFEEMLPGRIIRIRANHSENFDRYQLFRISKISKPMNSNGEMICTFQLQHISYDLDGMIVTNGLYTGTANSLLDDAIQNSTDPETVFTCNSDFPETQTRTIIAETPVSLRSFLAGMKGSMIEKFDGDLLFNNFTVSLLIARAGGIPTSEYPQVRYGKNIIEINEDINSEKTYTHIMPYSFKTVNDNTFIVYKNGVKTIALSGAYDIGRARVLPVDVTENFSTPEEITQLSVEAAGNDYIANNPTLKNPIRTINCKFADLRAYENEQNVPYDIVQLGAWVNVYFEYFGINESLRIIETKYDALSEEYTDLVLGEKRTSFVDSIAKNIKTIRTLQETVNILKQK